MIVSVYNIISWVYLKVRTTVSRLAVAPQGSNYGLRIFGYLHPAETGEHENKSVLLYNECNKTFVEAINKCTDIILLIDEYIFAVSSDDNSEFWLSLNESPENLQRLVYVGEVCLV